jgi:hypothetical protein
LPPPHEPPLDRPEEKLPQNPPLERFDVEVLPDKCELLLVDDRLEPSISQLLYAATEYHPQIRIPTAR